jgi:simple sugar transport system ATP-binding protein
VGAIEAIHLSLMAQRDAGKSILVVSVELEEIMALSDRILVMFEGRSMGELERAEFDEKTIGLMMAGIEKTQATQDALGDTL